MRPWLTALLALAAAGPALAQAGMAGDADGDRRLTLTEFQESRHKLIARADRDGDGRVGPAEWVAGESMVRRLLDGGGYVSATVDLGTGGFPKMDANKDGMVDAAEIDAYLARRFADLDTDHDIHVSPAELRAALGHPSR